MTVCVKHSQETQFSQCLTDGVNRQMASIIYSYILSHLGQMKWMGTE
jgi:hypothetical protein